MTIARQGPTPVGQRNRAKTIPARRYEDHGDLEEWPELIDWDETPDGDQDTTIWPHEV